MYSISASILAPSLKLAPTLHNHPPYRQESLKRLTSNKRQPSCYSTKIKYDLTGNEIEILTKLYWAVPLKIEFSYIFRKSTWTVKNHCHRYVLLQNKIITVLLKIEKV